MARPDRPFRNRRNEPARPAEAGHPEDADDDSAGASGRVREGQGRAQMPDYPPSPPPMDGPVTAPTPELASPDYQPPDYPTDTSHHLHEPTRADESPKTPEEA